MIGLTTAPQRIQSLPKYGEKPVPWFTEFLDGKPDFRVVSIEKIQTAYREGRCFICGQKLGKFLTFILGPMSTITRQTTEPPNHAECAMYAARVCPFLADPTRTRREAEFVEGPAAYKRNPGVIALWTVTAYRAKKDRSKPAGVVFDLTEVPAERVEWLTETREANRKEILEAIANSITPLRQEAARLHREPTLELMITRALRLIPEEKLVVSA